jgi:anion-transporting  ArsA/GET3 family ATPase
VAFFPDVRLHVVTGKGGTGKTTVAGALALALARDGRRVLLAEVEGRQGIAQLFGHEPLPYGEVRVAGAAGGGEVIGLAVDPELALIEYLELFYHLGRAGRMLNRIGAVDFVTTIAPGLRDVLLIGKIKEAAIRRHGAGHHYDAVVLDAPPTGRIVRFLLATDEVAKIVKVGAIRNQSAGVMALLRSSQTAVHLVTLLEEMPVQETLDGVAHLEAAGLPVGALLVNAVRDPQLSDEDLDAALARTLDLDAIGRSFTKAGLDVGPATVKVLADEAAEHAQRVQLQREEYADLEDSGQPLLELPLLADGVDLGTLRQLAELLIEEIEEWGVSP